MSRPKHPYQDAIQELRDQRAGVRRAIALAERIPMGLFTAVPLEAVEFY